MGQKTSSPPRQLPKPERTGVRSWPLSAVVKGPRDDGGRERCTEQAAETGAAVHSESEADAHSQPKSQTPKQTETAFHIHRTNAPPTRPTKTCGTCDTADIANTADTVVTASLCPPAPEPSPPPSSPSSRPLPDSPRRVMAVQPPPTKMPQQNFDVVDTYRRLLVDDAELTMPVAAIEALVLALAHTPATTVSETLDLLSTLTAELKRRIPNPISLSAGTDLFQRYIITTLQKPTQGPGYSDFDTIRTHLVQNGRLFVERAKEARDKIASFGRHFVRDGNTVLTNGGSRVVGALLRSAAETSAGFGAQGSIRFRVIYVVSDSSDAESSENIAQLRKLGIPVATIPPTAIAYSLGQVTQCFVGAEGVVENGGIISRLGTYQIAMLAKAANKPFYVVSESHKFVRLYPLGQTDLGIDQSIVDFTTNTDPGPGPSSGQTVKDEGLADLDETPAPGTKLQDRQIADAVDFTPPNLISGIITESGVLLPSAVSEELIKIWF